MEDMALLREEAEHLLTMPTTGTRVAQMLRCHVRLGLAILDRLEHLDRAVALLVEDQTPENYLG